MTIRLVPLFALAACLAAAGAADAKLKPLKKPVPPPAVEPEMAEGSMPEDPDASAPFPAPDEPEQPMFKVSFKIRFEGLEGSGNFAVRGATQSNYVVGGDTPFVIENAAGKGLEFKKHGTIVNILPVLDPSKPDTVDSQIQIEISGPGKPTTELKALPVQTFQLQTEFLSTLGKKAVLVDEPNKRVEVLIEVLKP
ncbi:MAG TPA: hypothetical protein DCM05_18330 [Elusimicrobia bacterium]|nr:hypothetical protein [Elusimicrobiota bacterium]